MNYATIKDCDIANGEGVRVSLFVSGCTHHCEGCFNRVAWDFQYGQPFTHATGQHLLSLLDHPWTSGLSLLGGEPMEPENQRVLAPFLENVRKTFPDKTIWCYSGYTYETDLRGAKPGELLDGTMVDPHAPVFPASPRCAVTDRMLSMIDVLVDGEFLISKKNIRLRFRGSENQRILHLRDGKIDWIEQ